MPAFGPAKAGKTKLAGLAKSKSAFRTSNLTVLVGPLADEVRRGKVCLGCGAIKAVVVSAIRQRGLCAGKEKQCVRAAIHKCGIGMAIECSRELGRGIQWENDGAAKPVVRLRANAENQGSDDAGSGSPYSRQIDQHSVVIDGKGSHWVRDLLR